MQDQKNTAEEDAIEDLAIDTYGGLLVREIFFRCRSHQILNEKLTIGLIGRILV